jgi:4-hydroxy-3-methylbut-2-en-1-yl diphosphate reductase
MSNPQPRDDGRRVLLARPRGFCAGVARAIATVESLLEEFGPPVYVRGQIVHNTHVVRSLEKRGAVFVTEVAEVPAGATLVLSAHGVAPVVHAEAATQQVRTIDATCPLVTKVHKEARRFDADDYDIILIGHEGHEEVTGITGEAPDRIQLAQGSADAPLLSVRDPEKVAWLSQTTLSVDETLATVSALRERFPALIDPPSDDICYATQNRQEAVKIIAAKSQLVIVAGSANSSNSKRLVEVALASGASAAYLVENADAINPAWLDHVSTLGITSGASVPEELVDGILAWLAARGYSEVEEVEAVTERMAFSLPRELGASAPPAGRQRRVP